MFEFLNLAQTAPIYMTIGVVMFVLGFLLSGNAKKSAGVGVISMLLKTIGIILALIAASYWITTAIAGWSDYSDMMLY